MSSKVHLANADVDFGNPWERMSDQESSDDVEECTCTLSDDEKVQQNFRGTLMIWDPEKDYKPEPETVVVKTATKLCSVPEAEETPVAEAQFGGDTGTVSQPEVHTPPRYVPDTHVALAWLVTLCFNVPFGLVAMFMSMKATKLYLNDERKRGRWWTSLSLVMSLFGIVTTVLIVMGVVLYLAVFDKPVRKNLGYG